VSSKAIIAILSKTRPIARMVLLPVRLFVRPMLLGDQVTPRKQLGLRKHCSGVARRFICRSARRNVAGEATPSPSCTNVRRQQAAARPSRAASEWRKLVRAGPEQARRRAARRLDARAAPAHGRLLRRRRQGSVSLGARIPRLGKRMRATWRGRFGTSKLTWPPSDM